MICLALDISRTVDIVLGRPRELQSSQLELGAMRQLQERKTKINITPHTGT